MDLEKLMRKKVSRKDFLKSLGFILLALIFFPRKALSFFNENEVQQKSQSLKQFNSEGEKVKVNGVQVMEIVDE